MVSDEFFGLPEFVVNRVILETAGPGNFRIYNYVLRGAVLVPQFMALISAGDLVGMIDVVEAAALGVPDVGLHIVRAHH